MLPDRTPPIRVVHALFFGVAFDLLLFGILTAQAYIYYISFPRDKALLKVAVVWVYLAGVAQTGLALVDFYTGAMQMFISFDDPRFLIFDSYFDHLWLSVTALTAAVAIVIQSMYAYRIYLISGKRWLTAMIISMSVGQLASGVFGAICYSRTQAVSSSVQILYPLETLSLIEADNACAIGFTWIWGPLNIICDLVITVCMVTFLVKYRKRTIRRQTRLHITRIIQIVVETGMATTILMVVYTVLFCLWARELYLNSWHPWPGLMMSKVYSNSLLVLLNNRATIANGRNTVESFQFIEVSGRGIEGDNYLRTRCRNSTDSTQAQ